MRKQAFASILVLNTRSYKLNDASAAVDDNYVCLQIQHVVWAERISRNTGIRVDASTGLSKLSVST